MRDEFIELIKNYNSIDFIGSEYFKELLDSLKHEDKIDCYFDCDGVLFDTIKVAENDINEDLKRKKEEDIKAGLVINDDDYFIDLSTISYRREVVDYFSNVNWSYLMARAGEIDNSCQKLDIIKASNVFKNTGIATHRHTYMNEGIAKSNIFKVRTNMTVFSIPVKIPKNFALPANGNILVDDNIEKITDWVNASGIGVLFNPKFEGFDLPTFERPYFITNNILDVFKIAYLKYYLEKTKNGEKQYKKIPAN